MPFGLTNAPAAAHAEAPNGPGFVAVYIDDVLVLSPTLTEHLTHLQAVIKRISEAGLKLKPRFVRSEVVTSSLRRA